MTSSAPGHHVPKREAQTGTVTRAHRATAVCSERRLEVLPWPGRASQPCPPTQPRLYLVDGQLLAAPSSVAVVVAGAVHILIQVLLTARLISTEGRVQSAIREGWKEREKLPKRTEGGDPRKRRHVFQGKTVLLREESGGQGTRFSNHSCCKNIIWLKECTG